MVVFNLTTAHIIMTLCLIIIQTAMGTWDCVRARVCWISKLILEYFVQQITLRFWKGQIKKIPKKKKKPPASELLKESSKVEL